MALPIFFENLNKDEENITQESIEFVCHNSALSAHLDILNEAIACFADFIFNYDISKQEENIYQMLGIRMFNSIEVSLKLILSGYYQNAAGANRDILETMFLLDYFTICPEKVERWTSCTEQERNKEFSPSTIRKALDERDGLDDMKRAERYKLLCSLGAHPTFQGFTLIIHEQKAFAGPFFSAEYLKAGIEELVNTATQAAVIFYSQFTHHKPQLMNRVLLYTIKLKIWLKEYHGHEFPSLPDFIDSIDASEE